MKQYLITGMTCASCQVHVEKAATKVKGAENVSVSLLTNTLTMDGNVDDQEVIKAIEDAGYHAKRKDQATKQQGGYQKLKAEEEALEDHTTPLLKKRLLWSAIFLVLLMYITMGHNMLQWPLPSFLDNNFIGLAITQMLITIIVMMINKAFFISGFKSLIHGAPNMDTLVALGSGVSFGWSLYVLYRMTLLIGVSGNSMDVMMLYHNQLYFESAAMIPALITVGKTLESISKGKTTNALKSLMKMAPKSATILRDGQEVTVDIEDVNIGDIFVVRPGEAIPVDGKVIEGNSAVDESSLSGESIPVDKEVNDPLSAATINQSGFLKAIATRIGEDTTFAQIIQMVSNTADTKAPIARIADKVSGIFVPSVIIIALIVFVVWLFLGQSIAYALEKAISVLVISCPCALGLATPVAIMAGNGVAAKNGILFKTSEALETTGHIQIVALDKTGTVTAGKPTVKVVVPFANHSENEVMKIAAALEKQSEHPLAKAIIDYAQKEKMEVPSVHSFMSHTGNGLEAILDGSPIYGGSQKYITSIVSNDENIVQKCNEMAEGGMTPVLFAKENQLIGIIGIADRIKEDSAQAMKELKAMGIETVMLTGDNKQTAKAIASQANIEHIVAGILPDGKEKVIADLQKFGKTMMVGDGINDAPSLVKADIGMAIGAGTDIAIDSADTVLMNSKLTDATAAIRLSRHTLRNIHENLFWAFAYNIILIPLAAGLIPSIQMNPMWGAAAMSLSSFTVCMNALRLNLVKVHDNRHDRLMKQKVTKEEMEKMIHENNEINEGQNCPIEKKEEENKMKETVKIEGMMCQMCEKHVKEGLEEIDGITSAVASHDLGNAVITMSKEVNEEDIKKAVEKAGYQYKGIEK